MQIINREFFRILLSCTWLYYFDILEGILFLKISFESKSFYRSTNLLNQFVGQEININILNITFPFKSVPVWMTKTYGHSVCDPEILLPGMVL